MNKRDSKVIKTTYSRTSLPSIFPSLTSLPDRERQPSVAPCWPPRLSWLGPAWWWVLPSPQLSTATSVPTPPSETWYLWVAHLHKQIAVHLHRFAALPSAIATPSYCLSSLPSCCFSFCMRLHCLPVSDMSLKHSALNSSEWFLILSIFAILGSPPPPPTPPIWRLRSGTDIVLHWWPERAGGNRIAWGIRSNTARGLWEVQVLSH